MERVIEKKLTEAGYRMFGIDENMGELIQSILKTKNIRYLKAIPFLIYKYKPNLENIFKETINKDLFAAILSISKQIFQESNIEIIIPNDIIKNYKLKDKLDYNEFKEEFEIQLRNEKKPKLLIDKQQIYAERNLQMWLSQLFTKKEKQIIKRMLEEKPISRTDYEYYSRKTKKKLNSIINLQDFARTIYTKTPKYDEELFELKRLLENWMLIWNISGSIESFHLSGNQIIINSREKSGDTSINGFSLKKIKNDRMQQLLDKYKEHDFI